MANFVRVWKCLLSCVDVNFMFVKKFKKKMRITVNSIVISKVVTCR